VAAGAPLAGFHESRLAGGYDVSFHSVSANRAVHAALRFVPGFHLSYNFHVPLLQPFRRKSVAEGCRKIVKFFQPPKSLKSDGGNRAAIRLGKARKPQAHGYGALGRKFLSSKNATW
jgi:hypothetical protein